MGAPPGHRSPCHQVKKLAQRRSSPLEHRDPFLSPDLISSLQSALHTGSRAVVVDATRDNFQEFPLDDGQMQHLVPPRTETVLTLYKSLSAIICIAVSVTPFFEATRSEPFSTILDREIHCSRDSRGHLSPTPPQGTALIAHANPN